MSGAAISAKSSTSGSTSATLPTPSSSTASNAAERAEDDALDHERPADEPVGRADELHDLDLAAAREQRQADRVGDQQDRGDHEQQRQQRPIVSFTTRVAVEDLLRVVLAVLDRRRSPSIGGRAPRRRRAVGASAEASFSASSGSSGVTRNVSGSGLRAEQLVGLGVLLALLCVGLLLGDELDLLDAVGRRSAASADALDVRLRRVRLRGRRRRARGRAPRWRRRSSPGRRDEHAEHEQRHEHRGHRREARDRRCARSSAAPRAGRSRASSVVAGVVEVSQLVGRRRAARLRRRLAHAARRTPRCSRRRRA